DISSLRRTNPIDHCHADTPGRHRSTRPFKICIGALRTAGITNIAAGTRHHARDSTRPLALLGIT
ncbi:hypothetical protein, partial [Actinoplanes sp. NPDC049118]|uniref:hypothetical protein n=1 Tax=Actinoplanes sp. NPDC049118 TaxID=3155769 RepID=UPI0033CBAA33